MAPGSFCGESESHFAQCSEMKHECSAEISTSSSCTENDEYQIDSSDDVVKLSYHNATRELEIPPGNVGTVSKTTASDYKPCNDPALWLIDEELRSDWALRGPHDCQNKDSDFTQSGREYKKRRDC